MTSSEELPTLAHVQRDCPLCHAPLNPAEPDECPRCDWVSGYRKHQEDTKRTGTGRDTAAAVMSIIPGVGHFYKGHIAAGMAALAGAIAIGLFVAGTVVATVGAALLLIPVYLLAVALHAYWAKDLALARRVAVDAAGSERARPVPEVAGGVHR